MSLAKNISYELETRKIMCFSDFLVSLIQLEKRGLAPKELFYKDFYGEYEKFCEGRGIPPFYRSRFWSLFRDGGMPKKQMWVAEDERAYNTCKLNIKYIHSMIDVYRNTVAKSGLAVIKIDGKRYNVVLNVRPADKRTFTRKKTPKVEGDENKNKNKDIDNNNS